MNNITTAREAELADNIGETTETAWTAPAELTYDGWSKIGRTLQQVNRSLNWWIGDWLYYGEQRYGETYVQAVEATDSSAESLRKYLAVARRVDKSVRLSMLSWSHHALVAYLPSAEHKPLLELAVRYELSTRSFKTIVELPDGLRAELLAQCTKDDLKRDQFFALLGELGTIAEKPVLRPTMVRPVDPSLPEVEEDDDDSEDTAVVEIIEPQESLFDIENNPFDEGETEEIYGDDLLSTYWEKAGVPVEEVTYSTVRWDGAMVRAEIDDDGEPVLAWEIYLS